jgi:hypothetical protein
MLLAAIAGGCVASQPELKLTSIERHQTWRQDFSHAYARRDEVGNVDVVLVDRAAEQALAGHRSAAPVHQVMYIRMLWTPARDMKAVTTNAAIKWYVIGRNQPQDILEYAGTGFVSFQPESDGVARLSIRNALLKPATEANARGSLTDPVGHSRIEGEIMAQSDDRQVSRVLDELKLTLAAANQARAAADDPTDAPR